MRNVDLEWACMSFALNKCNSQVVCSYEFIELCTQKQFITCRKLLASFTRTVVWAWVKSKLSGTIACGSYLDIKFQVVSTIVLFAINHSKLFEERIIKYGST